MREGFFSFAGLVFPFFDLLLIQGSWFWCNKKDGTGIVDVRAVCEDYLMVLDGGANSE